jgi:hypothetical protein
MSDVPNIPEITGARLRSVQNKDYSWFFTFTDGVSVATEDLWRFVKGNRVDVTSEDHGHKFGLPNRVDASVCVLSAIQDTPIQTARIDTATGDLFVYFSDKMFLQFLQTSGGYEAWRLFVGEQEFICTGGGEIAIFNFDAKLKK